jgi:hypothetical protein
MGHSPQTAKHSDSHRNDARSPNNDAHKCQHEDDATEYVQKSDFVEDSIEKSCRMTPQ